MRYKQMTMTATIAKEMTNKAIEERETERKATVNFIIVEFIEPAIRNAAEEGHYSARVALHNIDRAWRLVDYIVKALNDADFNAQAIAATKEIDVMWR